MKCYASFLWSLLLSASTIFLGSPTARAGEGTPEESSLTESCRAFLKSLPPETKFHWLEVPENREAVHSPKVRIFYYHRDFTLVPESATPVLFINGGPGGDSHSAFDRLLKRPGAETIPFIFMDQRGTGCSSPFPYTDATETKIERIRHYGSRDIVEDAEAIRKTLLGAKRKWILFGHSFGGNVIARYLILHPKSLKATFSHGSSIMSDGNDWVIKRMLSDKRIGAAYLEKFPGDDDLFRKAREQIPADACTIFTAKEPTTGADVTVMKFCGPHLLNSMNYTLLAFPELWPDVHAAISGLLGADGILSAETRKKIARTVVMDDSAVGSSFSTVINNARDIPGGLAIHTACVKAYRTLEARGEDFSLWFINECAGSLSITHAADAVIPTEEAKDVIRFDDYVWALKKNPLVRVSVYSSEFDSFVPKESFEEMVQALGSRITYKNFPFTGHAGFRQESEIIRAIAEESVR